MKKGRMVTREMCLSLMWVLACIAQTTPPAPQTPPGPVWNYSIVPVNTTVYMGKAATFTCSVVPGGGNINFTARFPLTTYSLQCPGNNIKLPSMSVYGNCDSNPNQVTASWQLSNIASDINASAFICTGSGLDVQVGYLWITGASKYYLMLFGCVMGGFFGILIIFIVTYVTLKRSEKLQECFKGKPEEEEDDVEGVEEETIKD